MRVTGTKIKPPDKVSCFMLMAKNTKEAGKTTKSMDSVSILGQTAPNTKVTIICPKNTVKAITSGKTIPLIMANGKKIICMAKVTISGKTVVDTLDHGKII